MLYDLSEVILDYPDVDSASLYDIFVTYYNPDDTSGIGGNIQSLVDGNGLEIHTSLFTPSSTPLPYRFDLDSSSYSGTTLRLKFVRENGYRSVVSQTWIVERADTTDTIAPVSGITSPSSDDHLTGGQVEVEGTSSDAGSGVQSVEIGINNGVNTVWRPVTQLRSDGTWNYFWSLPADGSYTLHSRARDHAGNLEATGAGIVVEVNQAPPGPATGLSAYDTPGDSGGSISILWDLSSDDGAGSDDVTGYAGGDRKFC
jgi:hypothetical protein